MSIVDGKEGRPRVIRQREYVRVRVVHGDAPALHAGGAHEVPAVPACRRLLLGHRLRQGLTH